MDKNINKERIYNIILKSKNLDKGYLIFLLETNCLDEVTNNITKDKTILKYDSTIKKGYLTGYEQFINLLNNFILYFRMELPTIVHNNLCIYYLFRTQCPLVLLSKEYYFNKNNYDRYNMEFKRLLVSNMYYNIQYIYSYFDKTTWKIFNITDNMNLANNKDVNILFNLMKLLTWSNINEYAVMYLFDSIDETIKQYKKGNEKKKDEIINEYYIQYKILIRSCLRKYKYIKKLVNNIE